LHYQNKKAYEYLNLDCSKFIACSLAKELLSIPIGEHLTEDDLKYVVNSIKEFFNKI
jgi:dTDP-4-amino-4,6-dideoxygalactose transaminase